MKTDPVDRDHHVVVVVGGGFGGLQAVSKLRHLPVEITLIDRGNFHLFQPLTYQVATGALSPGEIAYPLRAIFKRDRNVGVLLADVVDFDLDARELHLRSVAEVPAPERLGYDTLIVAGGSSSGVVLRCPHCGNVLAKFVTDAGRFWISWPGLSCLEVDG